MKIYRLISFLLAVLIIQSVSFGWTMTPQYAKEIAEKEAAVKGNPSSPDAHFDLAITYAYTNKVQEGLDELKKVSTLVPDHKAYARTIITKYYSQVEQSPSNWRIRFRLAFAYYFGGYKDYAIDELQNVANTDPKNPWPYGYMSVIQAEQGKWNKAVGSMKKAIALDSNVAAFHLGLGQGYYKLNIPMKGFSETMEAVRLKAMGY